MCWLKVDLNPAALTGVMHAGGEVTCFGGDLLPFKAEVTVCQIYKYLTHG